MFERLTDRTRRAVVLAQEEARSFGHVYIGTEHLLLGLLEEGAGVAAMALGNLGITVDLVQIQVGATGGQAQQPSSGHIPFTPHAKQSLEQSLHEAEQLDDAHVAPEHLLLALISVRDGAAARTLVKLGVDLDRVPHEVLRLRAGGPEFGFS